MGTSFSIDTPLQVAPYGISSVVSLVDDALTEQMRRYHSEKEGIPFEGIPRESEDFRAKRITAYLDLLDRIVSDRFDRLRSSPFAGGSEITRYFEMLPGTPLKKSWLAMKELPDGPEKTGRQEDLRGALLPGSIDVNIMTKVDRTIYRDGEPLPPEHCEAMAALRGYARSTLKSAIVFSAGLNPRLYSYASTFEDFLPDAGGELRKKIILKVSDYRSAVVQGKFFAKRGLWVSEFRVESGLNCGGHAFATNGHLTGPILEEFTENRGSLREMLHAMYSKALTGKGLQPPGDPPPMRLSVQGGIGDADENEFLLTHYGVDATGWGSPFLLCPDVTAVDEEHLEKLRAAGDSDVFLSRSSPLGLPFWNLRTSASESLRERLVADGRPGSSCPKGHLRYTTEFTKIPLCPASRTYLKKKLDHLPEEGFNEQQLPVLRESALAKSCLCRDLAGAATLKYGIEPGATPALCPGPNIVHFSKISNLEETVAHIYGRLSLLETGERPHMFIGELKIYVGYLRRELESYTLGISVRQPKYFLEFRDNLMKGIEYYHLLAEQIGDVQRDAFRRELSALEEELEEFTLPAAEG